MAEKTINIGGRLHSTATGNVVSGANEIFDYTKGQNQEEINANTYSKEETYNKNELNNLITTPDVQYITVPNFDNLPASGSANTIYRVSNWDGGATPPAVDASKYSEYGWDGGRYILLSVKSAVDEVFDVSVFNAESGIAKAYETLTAALGGIPANRKKGGMSIKFIQTTPATYNVVKTEGVTELPTGTELDSASSIASGTYTASQLSDFSTLPTTATPVVYYISNSGEITTYTTWTITKVQSSDNKYVQWRYMGTAVTGTPNPFLDTANWQGVDDEPTAGSDNLVKSGGVSKIFGAYKETEFIRAVTDNENKLIYAIKPNGDIVFGIGVPNDIKEYVLIKNAEILSVVETKVDKVEGKGLSSNDYNDTAKDIVDSHSFVENNSYVDVKTDNTGKLLEYTKADGKKGFTGGVEISGKIDTDCAEVMSGSQNDFIEITTDDEDKIIEGIRSDGKHQFNAGVTLSQGQEIKAQESGEWINVVLDNDGKIIEGIKSDGKKFIGEFDSATLDKIKNNIASGSVFKIATLDSHFDCALPYNVDGIKGSPDAKYTFNLPLGKSWNIRVKFKITEDILNKNKTSVLASINGAEVKAYPVPLIQSVTDIGLGEYMMHNTWPATIGGICYNHQTMDNWRRRMNVGRQAISVQYVGEGSSVSLENDGNGLILTIDGTVTTYSFEDYPTMEALYTALKENEDINVNPIAIDCHDSSELAKFSAVTLVNTVEGHNNQGYEPVPITFIDKAPFYLHYSLDVDKWHQIEIVKIGNIIYSTCDGNVVTYQATTDTNELVLGGQCGVLFKDLEIDVTSPNDVEIINNFIISSVNPYIVIFEGHSMVKYPACEANSNVYNLGTDTLAYVFEVLKQKGYVAVSIEDISDYYTNGRPLPKRCYTMIFDDFEWSIALDPEYRRIFEENGARPALAIITSRETAITHNGTTITKEKASEIAHNAGFSLCTHTRTHRSTYAVAPSDRLDVVKGDILDADLYNINGLVYVYPGGNDDPYMHEVLEYAGVKLGIQIPVNIIANNTLRSRFALNRINIGRVYVNGQKIDFKNNALSRVY